MKVILYELGKKPMVKEIKNDLKVFKEIVGGWIETFTQPNGIILVCNEEGKLIGLPANKIMFGDLIVGNFFLCRAKGEDFVSVTDEDIKYFIK